MPFNVKKFNHSPQWYRDRYKSEEGTAPLRAMLTKDMKFVGADIDTTHTYLERIHTYEESWNGVLSGKNKNADAGDLQEVMEREGLHGFRSVGLYAKPPFTTITRLMEREGLTTTDLREFLRWKAKNDNVTKARDAKAKKRNKTKKVDPKEHFRSFLTSRKKRDSVAEF
jgi:hypothetical protein